MQNWFVTRANYVMLSGISSKDGLIMLGEIREKRTSECFSGPWNDRCDCFLLEIWCRERFFTSTDLRVERYPAGPVKTCCHVFWSNSYLKRLSTVSSIQLTFFSFYRVRHPLSQLFTDVLKTYIHHQTPYLYFCARVYEIVQTYDELFQRLE